MFSIAFAVAMQCVRWPGVARRQLTFLLVQESKQRTRPLSAFRLRRFPALLPSGGVSPKLAALRQGRALIRPPVRCSALSKGQQPKTEPQHRGKDAPWRVLVGLTFRYRPVEWAEQRSAGRIKKHPLFERSEFWVLPARREQRREPAQPDRGKGHVSGLLLCAKEVTAPPGAIPAYGRKSSSPSSAIGSAPLTPTLSRTQEREHCKAMKNIAVRAIPASARGQFHSKDEE